MTTLISDKYAAYKAEVNERWDRLKANEEELNRIFAKIYDMVGRCPSRWRTSTSPWCACSTPKKEFFAFQISWSLASYRFVSRRSIHPNSRVMGQKA